MAKLRKIVAIAPELLDLNDQDLTVLDLALCTVIDAWDKHKEQPLQYRGPLVSPAQVQSARFLHEQVLKIKLALGET